MDREQPILRAHEHWRRHRRVFRRALLASLLFHLLIFLIFNGGGTPPSPFAAAGPRAGDDRAAAAGGGGIQTVALITPPELEVIPRPPAPIAVPDITVEVEDQPEPEIQPVTIADAPGVGGGEQGQEAGPGLEDGTGRGDGGTAASGRFRVIPPSPRGLILPPSDRPGSVRGKEIAVWVFVTETGRVVADSTRLQPSTGNSGFDDRLRRQAAQWIFEPARRAGRPIAEWFQYVISL